MNVQKLKAKLRAENHDARAENRDTVDAIITVIIVTVMVVVGAVVVGYFQSAINTTSTSTIPAQARSQINTTFTNIWNTWPLMNVIIIAIIIAVIIASIMVLRSRGGPDY